MRNKFGGTALSVLFFIISCTYASKNTYIAMFPKTIRPDLDTVVHVQILNAASAVKVTASLIDSKDNVLASNSAVHVPGTTSVVMVPLMIPREILPGDYKIKVDGEGGLTFTNSSKVTLKMKSASVMIQTDKGIYKPGQTVRFRIFGFFPDLSIVDKPMDIAIFDPNGNKISQWRNVNPTDGVYTDHMLMSDKPVMGQWKIEAVQDKDKSEKAFTVEEYVLPKFEVSVDTPAFGLTSDKELVIKVKAKYTFGKPVKGVGMLRVRPEYVETWRRKHKDFAEKIEKSFDIDGETQVAIPMSQLTMLKKNLAFAELIVEANVTETATGRRMNASTDAKFYEYENKVEFSKSLPPNYKPGLKYTVIMKVTKQDGSPVYNPTSRVGATVIVTHPLPTTTTTELPPTPAPPAGETPLPKLEIIRPPWGPQFPRTEDRPQEHLSFEVPPNGVIAFEIVVPSDATRVTINAEFENSTDYLGLDPSQSPSDNYIQASIVGPSSVAGSTTSFQILTTEPAEIVYYQILSKGRLIDSNTIEMVGLNTTVNVMITNDMAPKSKFIVYYVRADKEGEIVSDGITFNVEGTFRNQVSLKFDATRVKPGSEVVVEVKADPDSVVHVLAVDKSVLLLKSGNDVTESDVLGELESYDNTGNGNGNIFPIFWDWRWPMPSGGQDAFDVFDKNGMAVLTDALLYNHQEPLQWQSRRGIMLMNAPMAMFDAGPMPMQRKSSGGPARNLKPVTRVRKFFPETWLWSSAKVGANGRLTLGEVAPDTITSWVATAFAVNKNTGLGLTKTPSSLEVFQDFFISLNLPYSVVRGEVVLLQINIFNYLDFPVSALAMIAKNEGWKNIVTYVNKKKKYRVRQSAFVGREMIIQPGEIYQLYFPIVPQKLGDLEVNVTVLSNATSDRVIRTLKVEPEGTEKEFNTPVLLTLDNAGTISRTVDVTFPKDTVVGSRRTQISVIGDIMGPSVNGLDKLLKMPYGCGEQNMLNFAPNIFIQKYLTVTNNLSPDIEAKAKEYMLKGYQRELTYKHEDGSYSAFGKSDKSGSTWLTAFVLKSFAQASNFITIDNGAMNMAVDFLIKQQNPNGTFNEPGKVLHSEMQGGSAKDEGALTAFVLVALKEAEVIPGLPPLGKAISKAVQFLESEVDLMEDVYELAITAYALDLAGSPRVTDILSKLSLKAITKDGMTHWETPEVKKEKWKSWRPSTDQAKGVDIELTAYILLTYAKNNNLNEGIPLLKWITAQRNSDGGFVSTQDTIIALQALSQFAGLIFSPTFNMLVTVSSLTPGVPFSKDFRVDQVNALILQTVDIPDEIEQLSIEAKGSGIALAQVSTRFNIMGDLNQPDFNVNVTLSKESTMGFDINVCARYLKKSKTGMSIMEIGIPSGMTPDMETLDTSQASEYKLYEIKTKKVYFYLDEMDRANRQCIGLYIEAQDKIGEMQASVVKVYDYYNPESQITKLYEPTVLSSAGLCDLCDEQCFCPKPPKVPERPTPFGPR